VIDVAVDSGQVVYRGRAFGQDAEAAMRGDIVRALIELITNADDAYGGTSGQINITIQPSENLTDDGQLVDSMPLAVTVADAAKGLNAERMKRAFSVLGGQNEDFMAGIKVRGLLGRGAKDAAGMGAVRFESIHNGLYSCLDLDGKGQWQLQAADRQPVPSDWTRLRLAIAQSGLSATIFVKKAYRVPSGRNLAQKIGSHAQLRELVGRRQVSVTDLRKGETVVVADPPEIRGDILLDKELDLGSDYGAVQLQIRKLPARDKSALSDYSEHGILVSGSSASYMNTLFHYHGRPESSWLAGEVKCPQIETLVRDFDERQEREQDPVAANPLRLVSRDRDGLVEDHPFFKALEKSTSRELLPILDDLATKESSDHKPGAKLQQAFSVAKTALASDLNRAIREIDEEEPAGGGGNSENEAPLVVIPPRLMLHEGAERTLSVRIKDGVPPAFTVERAPDAEDLVAVVAQSSEFKSHPRLEAQTATFMVRAGLSHGDTRLIVEAGGHSAPVNISVVPEAESPDEVVHELKFEKKSYRVAPKRARNVRLLAPAEWEGESVRISHHMGPQLTLTDQYVFKASPDGAAAECSVRVQAEEQLGTAKIQAESVGSTAMTTVVIHEQAARAGLDLDIQLLDQSSKNRRAFTQMREGRMVVRVFGRHPTLRQVLGRYDDNKQRYSREDDPEARAVLAEVIGLELASFLVEREAAQRPQLGWDAARVISKQQERASRLISVAQRAMREEESAK
jgi:hypothetical protein